MAIDFSGIYFFMPVFSFLFVLAVVYAILLKSKIFGDTRVYFIVSLVMAIIFMSFSSLELYVRTLLPWFIALLVIVFLILLLAGFITGDLSKFTSKGLAWTMVGILIVIVLIVSIYVFNPVLHPSLIITSGGNGNLGIVDQVEYFFTSSRWAGSILLFIVAAIVAWVVSWKVKK